MFAVSRPALALIFATSVGTVAQAQSLDILLNCSSCHSLNASTEERATSPYPVLNGQPARYLVAQLEAYRTGERQHPQMSMTAEALGAEAAPAMARMYAAAPVPELRLPEEADVSDVAITLHEDGAWERGIAPCSLCHNLEAPQGISMAGRNAPRLHGQPPGYLARQLEAYADGSRQTGSMQRMQEYAEELTPGEISALADYFASFK